MGDVVNVRMGCVLANLSDGELLSATRSLVGRSNQLLAALLAHLAEVETRGVHRTRACASLYTYCIYELRLSEDEAYRRVAASRFARRFPPLLEAVASGELHLTGLLMLGPHLTRQNCVEVLARAKHRTKKEVARLVRELDPLPDVPSIIEPLGPALGRAPGAATWQVFTQSLNPVRNLQPGQRPRDWMASVEDGSAENAALALNGTYSCAESDSTESESSEPSVWRTCARRAAPSPEGRPSGSLEPPRLVVGAPARVAPGSDGGAAPAREAAGPHGAAPAREAAGPHGAAPAREAAGPHGAAPAREAAAPDGAATAGVARGPDGGAAPAREAATLDGAAPARFAPAPDGAAPARGMSNVTHSGEGGLACGSRAPARYKVQFTASDEYVSLVEEARALLSGSAPNVGLDELHLRAMRSLVAELKKRKYAVATGVSKEPGRSFDSRSANDAASDSSARERSREEPRDIELERGDASASGCGAAAANGNICGEAPREGRVRREAVEQAPRGMVEDEPPPSAREPKPVLEREREASGAAAPVDGRPEQVQAGERRRVRSIPAAVRRVVFERDGARCTYVSETGERCRESAFLELHHLQAFALGGPDSADNLTLRCRAHNALAAEEEFGLEQVLERRDALAHESFTATALARSRL